MLPEDRKKLFDLIEKWTRAEIMARLCPFYRFPEWGEASQQVHDFADEIRELRFGTSDLVELGHRWGLPIDKKFKKGKDAHERRDR